MFKLGPPIGPMLQIVFGKSCEQSFCWRQLCPCDLALEPVGMDHAQLDRDGRQAEQLGKGSAMLAMAKAQKLAIGTNGDANIALTAPPCC